MGKKYYWLQLKDDFFNQKEIKKLRKIAGGDTYTVIYLKMLLLSLKNDGKLYFDGVEENFAEEISLEIDEEIDNVKIVVMFLLKNNLIEEISEDEYFMSAVPELIGKESDSASRVRKYREKKKLLAIENKKTLQCNSSNVTSNECNNLCNTEIEIDIDIEKDIYSNSNNPENVNYCPTDDSRLSVKEKEIEDKSSPSIILSNINNNFEELWKLYPIKEGKGNVKAKKKKELYKIGFDKMKLAIERYLKNTDLRRLNFPDLNYKNGSTFFNSGYIDFLEETFEFYKPIEKSVSQPIQSTNYE
jgi:predicted phage replisome organizer